MLAMIRINLLGNAKTDKKRGGLKLPSIPNVGLLLALLVFVSEGAVAFKWHEAASIQADKAVQKLGIRKTELEALTRGKEEIIAMKAETDKLTLQKGVFDELFADKVGPVNALTYLSFILQPRDEATTSADDLKSMEAAGWRVAWNAQQAWFTSIHEDKGEITITGEALEHNDVAEVTRRLESSPYFRSMKLKTQERKRDEKLGRDYISFTIGGSLVYLIDPVQAALPAGAVAGVGDADGGATGGDGSAGGDGSPRSDAGASDGSADASADAEETATTPSYWKDAQTQGDEQGAPDAAKADAAKTQPDVAPPADVPPPEPIVPKPVKAEDKPAPPAKINNDPLPPSTPASDMIEAAPTGGAARE